MSQTRSDRDLNGYRVIYIPEHPRAMKNKVWDGYVYEHIVVAEKSLGRSIRPDEVVHHLDSNRSNNRHENLLVIGRGEHAKLHVWLNKSASVSKGIDEQGKNSGKPKFCKGKGCKNTLQDKNIAFCSTECAFLAARKVKRPDKETLQKEIEENSYLALGRKYGVSDNAIRKWARKYGIIGNPEPSLE